MACVVVVDVETTGLNAYRHDRIVELAALVIALDGTVLREFVTLVNPDRDIGPTRLHGLTTRDIMAAPRFAEIAGTLVDVVDGCVALAGHNVRFDHTFLAVEYGRVGYQFPDGPTLCTMQLAGGASLSGVCADYGIVVEGEPHTAYHDACATARLLTALLRDAPCLASKISQWPQIIWRKLPKGSVAPVTRDASRRCQAEPPTYVQRLLARVHSDVPCEHENSAIPAYAALLIRALEDRQVDQGEGLALLEFATRWSIPPAQIESIHWDYLLSLAEAAVVDRVVTQAERRELDQVAQLLGFDPRRIDEALEVAVRKANEAQMPPSAAGASCGEDFAGKTVCFTGECQCSFGGEAITREMAAELATSYGLIVAESVTKKLDLLVVADPMTQSGKAKKARQYGVRIIHEPVFWRALGVEVG